MSEQVTIYTAYANAKSCNGTTNQFINDLYNHTKIEIKRLEEIITLKDAELVKAESTIKRLEEGLRLRGDGDYSQMNGRLERVTPEDENVTLGRIHQVKRRGAAAAVCARSRGGTVADWEAWCNGYRGANVRAAFKSGWDEEWDKI